MKPVRAYGVQIAPLQFLLPPDQRIHTSNLSSHLSQVAELLSAFDDEMSREEVRS